MDVALLASRVLLSIVFALAGLSKLADQGGTRQAIAGFGVPSALAGPFALLLPIAELTVAIVLIPTISAWWGALGALALLVVFIFGIGINLARGARPECHCFGQLYSKPVGWGTLLRNAVLLVIAGFIVWRGWAGGGASATAWLGELTDAERIALAGGTIALLVTAGALWSIFHTLRQNGRLLVRLDALETGAPAQEVVVPGGLPVGSPAPTFSLSDLDGKTVSLDGLRAAGKPVVLFFTDPSCSHCRLLAPAVGHWQRAYADRLTIAVITRGTTAANMAAAEDGLSRVLLQKGNEVGAAYRVHYNPSAIVVRPDGTVGSILTPGGEAIQLLLGRTIRALVSPPIPLQRTPQVENGRTALTAASIGESAPPFTLQDLSGRPTELADFRGHPTVLLFWNTRCGFCERMLPDLKAWEVSPPEGAPRLVVICAGTEEQVRATGFSSPVLLDPAFHTGPTYGANGTPMAVLVDAEGAIASDVAVGAEGVLALLAQNGRVDSLAG